MKRALATGALAAIALAAWWLSRPGNPLPSPVDPGPSPVPVWTTSGALFDLSGRILGDATQVRRVALASGLPARDDLVAMQRARVVLGLGPAAGDGWMGLVGLPAGARVELAEGAWGETLVAREGAIIHRHGPAGQHTHVEREPCPWVEPRRARELLDLVEAELARRGMAPRARSDDARALATELERLAAGLDAIAGAELLASSGAYRHLATRPGWSVEVAAIDTSAPPTDAARAALTTARARRPAARLLVVSDSPHAGWADALAGLGLACAVVPLDADGRYFDALGPALEELARRLGPR